MKPFYTFAFVLVYSINAFSFPRAKSDTLSAASVIKKSTEAYASLKTYVDSGKTISEFQNTRPFKKAIYFKTAYSIADGFNFEYYEPGNTNSYYIINKSNGKISSWWGISDKTETFADLTRPLGAAAGVSSRTSVTIPSLIFQKEPGIKTTIYSSFKPASMTSESLNNVLCYHISGKNITNDDVEIWVAKKDFLIRKISRRHVMDPTTTANTQKVAEEIFKSKFLKDSSALAIKVKELTDVKLRTETQRQLDSLSRSYERHKALMNMTENINRSNEKYTIKTTMEFFPNVPLKIDKGLLAFRPRRYVEL